MMNLMDQDNLLGEFRRWLAENRQTDLPVGPAPAGAPVAVDKPEPDDLLQAFRRWRAVQPPPDLIAAGQPVPQASGDNGTIEVCVDDRTGAGSANLPSADAIPPVAPAPQAGQPEHVPPATAPPDLAQRVHSDASIDGGGDDSGSSGRVASPVPVPPEPVPVAIEPEPVAAAMADVVGAFTALRQEAKLQTRSSRELSEQTERTLSALNEAIRRFDAVQPDEKRAARRAAEPLAEALAGLDEAFDRGLVALEQARQQLTGKTPEPPAPGRLDELLAAQPAWSRWLNRDLFAQLAAQPEPPRATDDSQPVWDALQEGYRLMQNRLRRSMQACGLRRIPTVGGPVDLHCMTVVEVAVDASEAPGTVVAELRPGYFWNDAVLRFAEVRVVRGGTEAAESTELEYDSSISES